MASKRPKNLGNDFLRPIWVAPDGGWGWMVVVGSFFANMIIDGVNHSFGLFINAFQNTYGTSQGLAALVGSLFASLQLIAGPFASGFINKFGSRTAMFSGAIMCAFGFFICVWSKTIGGLLITYGVIGGISCSLIYVPAIVHVAYYFESKRALATGISTAGSGFGLFTLAPLIAYLINEYSWKGTMWFVSGAFLNCAVCASLLRPLRFNDSVHIPEIVVQQPADSSIMEWELDAATDASPDTSSPETTPKPKPKPKAGPLQELLQRERVGSMDSHFAKQHKPAANTAHTRRRFQSTDYLHMSHKNNNNNHHDEPDHMHILKPLSRQDIFFSGSIRNLREFTDFESYHERVISESAKSDAETRQQKHKIFALKIVEFLKDAVDFKLLRKPVMAVICLLNFLGMAGFFIPLFYMNNRAQSYGISAQKASFLLSIEGIANTAGRIIFGLIADRKWFSALAMQNMCMIVCGCVTVAFPAMIAYESMIVYAAVFGFLIGAFNCLPSIILVDTIGLEKLTDAFGLLILCRGISAMAGSPIAGSLYDLTGSYDPPFYFGGSLILASGIVGLLVPLAKRFSDLRDN